MPVALDGLDRLELAARLEPGALWLVDVDTQVQERALIDAACGLAVPSGGQVRFRGHDWTTLPPTFADALRGRIGLVPRRGLFLPYADMATSILLTARFHRLEADALLIAEAGKLARRFGLPGLPSGAAPPDGSPDALAASCVRALLAEPLLVIVESQPQLWRSSIAQVLLDAMQDVRERGGAAIWCFEDDPLFDDPAVPATARYRLSGRGLRRIVP